MIEPCSTLQESLAPGRNRSRIRASFGSTTWPLLDRVAVVAYCLTIQTVSQGIQGNRCHAGEYAASSRYYVQSPWSLEHRPQSQSELEF